MEMYGFKGFNSDLTCRGFQYEIGKTYKHDGDRRHVHAHDGEIELCNSGCHFCKTLRDVFAFYSLACAHRYCKVKATGKIRKGKDKCVTNEITILEEIEITPELLNELAHSDDADVRKAVALHPKTDPETLKELAKDEDLWIRLAVAGNHKTDIETLKELAKDEYWGICIEAVLNPVYRASFKKTTRRTK